jgi:asparagine synthase (glutamine-hydrolysing)
MFDAATGNPTSAGDRRDARGPRRWIVRGVASIRDGCGLHWEAESTDGAERFREGSVEVLCRGAPVFLDAPVAALAASDGPAAAWRFLYRQHGVRAPERVHGRFAVIVLDGYAGRAFLAVDRFATEPLCYAASADAVAFADRADAVPGHASDVDPQAIFDYLWFHVIPAPRTIFKGVKRLLPGTCLGFEKGRCNLMRYWRPEFEEGRRAAAIDALSAEFRELLRDAVARTATSGPLGCYLSGGTDSSTVAGMTGIVTGRPARTYSIGFDVPGYDEMQYARIAAAHFRTEHHEYYVSPRDIVDHVGSLAAHFDQPFGNSSALPAYCCARLARQDGIASMLAGDGGDELFAGNTRYARQQLFALYDRVPAPLRGSIESVTASRRLGALPLLGKVASYVEQASVPMPDRMHMYNLLLRIGFDEIFEPDFLDAVDTGDPRNQQRQVFAAVTAESLVNRMLAYDWKYTLSDNDLPKVVSSASLAGIAVAFPMLDERLLEFSLRLAPALKLRGLRLRWFFKHALAEFLPGEILRKRKHGFGLPFGTWAIAHRELRDLVGDLLGALKHRSIVRGAFIDGLLQRRLPEHPGYYGEMVWILMMLEQWHQAHEAAENRVSAPLLSG